MEKYQRIQSAVMRMLLAVWLGSILYSIYLSADVRQMLNLSSVNDLADGSWLRKARVTATMLHHLSCVVIVIDTPVSQRLKIGILIVTMMF